MLQAAFVLQNLTSLNIITIGGNLFPNYLTVNIKLSNQLGYVILNSRGFKSKLEVKPQNCLECLKMTAEVDDLRRKWKASFYEKTVYYGRLLKLFIKINRSTSYPSRGKGDLRSMTVARGPYQNSISAQLDESE